MTPNILYIAFPVILVLMTSEMWYSWKEDLELYDQRETKLNILVGLGSAVSGLLGKFVLFNVFQLAYSVRIMSLPSEGWVWVVAFLGADFSYYWHHRASHQVNLLWASHSVHHSSETFNISVAIRIPWTNLLTGNFLFWAWMPLLGIEPVIVFFSYQLILFYQSWLHTEVIDRLPASYSFLFNTPSHHRVHHSSNTRYLDKNHGGVFILWDRLFGTFQQEDEKPVYGLTNKMKSGNVWVVNFGELISLINQCRKAESFAQVLRHLFFSPGWSKDSKKCRRAR